MITFLKIEQIYIIAYVFVILFKYENLRSGGPFLYKMFRIEKKIAELLSKVFNQLNFSLVKCEAFSIQTCLSEEGQVLPAALV